MKRFFRSVLLIAFAILLVNISRVSAAGEVVTVYDGASIRLQSESAEQGLRFYATLDESVKANEHGFYLVYGKTTIAELEAAITAAAGGTITLNDKTVFKVQVPGVIAGNEFSVVLLGIPEAGYFDNVSVIPYVVVDEENVYSAATVSRSVAEVALKMANAGEDISDIQGVNAITATAKKKVAINADGNLAVSGGVYELNPYNLREEFVKDWNAKFGLSLANLDATTFYNSAKTGLTDAIGSNKDLAPSNIYKFFNDAVYKVKWGWFLEYLKSVDGTTHPSRQIVAIQGDGTNGDYVLYNGLHLSYSITNFFNREHETGNYTAINFIDGTKYATIKDYNNKVYVDASKYDFHNVGDTIVLPAAATPPAGYSFTNYLIDGTSYNAGADYVITTDDVVVEPVYTPIEYTVTFYVGENELTNLATTYNVEGQLLLPELELEGYIFEGWYDNVELSGSVITSIPEGSTGNKVYYAKLTETTNVPVEVTYKLNGGMLSSSQMIEHRNSVHIIATRYSTAGDPAGKAITVGTSRGGLYWYVMGFKETAVAGVYELVGKGVGYSDAEATLYVSYHDNIDSPFKDAIIAKYGSIAVGDLVVIETLPSEVTGSTLIDMYFMAANAATADLTETLIEPTVLFVPTIQAGTFLGWYDNPEFTGQAITTFPGYLAEDAITSITYYAKWEESAAEEYNITYNYNGGHMVYATKDELINGFLEAFYAYLGLTSDLTEFKHGVGKTTGYDGTWHSEYKAKIYAGPRPTATDENYFASAAAYMETWLPFFDNIDNFVKTVNDTQYFWGGTWTGLIRLREWVTDIKPASHVSDATMAMMPEVPVTAVAITKGKVGVPLTLQQAYKTGATFVGWYRNADFSGEVVTVLNETNADGVTLYAKFE